MRHVQHRVMNSDLFQICVDVVLTEEGGTANHRRDPGGLTRFGISQRSYPSLDIASLTRDQAIALYKRDYWQPIRGDELPPGLALLLFDCAVNQGPVTAIQLLQASLRVAIDGQFGPITLQALQHSGLEVLVEFCARRAWRYEINRNEVVFGLGWFRRLLRVYTQAYRLALPS